MNQAQRNERIPRTLEQMDMQRSFSTGLLSGLQAQSEITELLDELYYDGLLRTWEAQSTDPIAPVRCFKDPERQDAAP